MMNKTSHTLYWTFTFSVQNNSRNAEREEMRETSIVEAAVLAICVLLTIIFAGALHATRISFDAGSSSLFILLILVPLFVHAFYRTIRPDEGVATLTFTLATQTWGATVIGGIILVACRWQMPFVDAHLVAIDAAMGINVATWVETVAQMPATIQLLQRVYGLSAYAIIVVPWLLTFVGRCQRARELSFLFVTTLAICGFIGSLFPAAGSLIYLQIPAATNGGVPGAPTAFMKIVEAYRSGSTTMVSFDRLEGIINFPSFHTCLALMYIWAAKGMPRYIFWPAVAFSGLTLCSIFPFGGHYFVDAIGGMAVFGIAIGMVRWLERSAIANRINAYAGETARQWRSPPSEAALPR